uniref:Uncharacterized protein n=1 Tax=Ditylenchus dipsaci TaxID=166011 RepID=A0A915DSF1_9BILA
MNVNIVVDKTISSNDLADLGTYLAEVLSGLHLDGSSKTHLVLASMPTVQMELLNFIRYLTVQPILTKMIRG